MADSSEPPQPLPAIQAEAVELRKPHEMIVMIPRSSRVTLTGRRIYNVLLHISQERLSALDAMPAADFLFEAPLPSILRTTGSNGDDRGAAKRYLKEMRGLEVDWESTAPGDGPKWRGFSMLSEVVIEVRRGENWVLWSFPPTIMSALREPQRWARINLEMMTRLGTYAGVALYEICTRYRDNPSGLTSRKPAAWWAAALSPSAASTDTREWRKLKSERIKPAIDEINEETDLEIELIEHKQGRAVVEVQFAVRKKRGEARRPQAEGPVDASLVIRGEGLGIPAAKVEALIKEFGEGRVREKLDVLDRRVANTELRSVESYYAYLRSLLRSGDTNPGEPGQEVDEPLQEQQQATPPTQSWSNPWLNDRIASLKLEFQGLSIEQRRAYATAAMSTMTERGHLSAVITRRFQQGDYLHGLLGSFVVREYATAVYGPGWDKQQDGDLFADQGQPATPP